MTLVSVLVYLPDSQSSNSQDDTNQNLLAEASATYTKQESENLVKKYDETYTRIYDRVSDSVVQITSTRTDVNTHITINGNPLSQQSVALGSGFVFDDAGHIITNNHVVEESKNVEVTFNDGNSYPAKIVGTDSYNDIAVLEITEDTEEQMLPLSFANSSILVVGEPAIAIGNPFGLSNTMTTGIISQTGRLLPTQ
ncbi:MAG: trypsin-like peptidase domain-containing protein, partial [Nitrosarchaeum sp.]|nr:trypsin-like peptidase domain-containing protein [Nitrosarchaeum sp.]